MTTEMKCPECGCEHSYKNSGFWNCPECAHEWSETDEKTAPADPAQDLAVRDAYGNVLQSGDSVTVLKDLKVKGSSLVVKGGTKVKNIRIVDGVDGHNIACKIDGVGAMNLKSEFVKKA